MIENIMLHDTRTLSSNTEANRSLTKRLKPNAKHNGKTIIYLSSLYKNKQIESSAQRVSYTGIHSYSFRPISQRTHHNLVLLVLGKSLDNIEKLMC